MKPENLMFIDIETVPLCARYEELSEAMQLLWQRKSTLLAPQEKNFSETFKTLAGIYSEFGKIICIGCAWLTPGEEDYTTAFRMLSGDDEAELLMEFSSLCDSFFTSPSKQFCGHNIREFDLPFLCRRMLIQNIPLPRILKDLQSKKPWENPVCDTLQWWKFGEYKQFTSLALLTEVLGIPSPKESMDGSEVADAYYLKNNLQGIVRYCRRDVEAVMQVWFRLNGMHHFTALRKADSIYEGSERTD